MSDPNAEFLQQYKKVKLWLQILSQIEGLSLGIVV